MHVDNYQNKGKRRLMVEYLKEKGISDEKVLDAMNNVPRHFFLDSSLDSIAYEDRALQILCNQTISQPSTVAFQTQLLNVKQREKILEIGTGSGYQTSVLYYLKARVYTIERMKQLYDKAKKVFEEMNIHPQCFFGDGYLGLPGYQPFDKIIVTCGAPFVPEELVNQLKVGGIMIIPVGQGTQTMHKITKISENETKTETFGNFRFVPMLENKG